MSSKQAYRAKLLHFVGDPQQLGDDAYQYFEDGLLVVESGRIEFCGGAAEGLELYQGVPLKQFENRLIIPGFVDTHVHFAQLEMIAAYGEQLLDWLDTYTFPTEQKFADEQYAYDTANAFLDELLRNGTTTALVFGTVHPQSVEAFFRAAEQRNLRMIAGKVLMDRHAPKALCDSAEQGYQESKALIERWHGVSRLSYAVTPRFAPSCTAEQLTQAGKLLDEYPGVYLHTHLAENKKEVAWVADLFPAARSYLDVYDQAHLLSRRSVFAHGIHLDDCDCERLQKSHSAIAHCPTSNLFLGSGLIDLMRLKNHDIRVGLGSDVGAGTSFSMFRSMDEAYKIQQLRGAQLDPFSALYMATLGGAEVLDLADKIGNFTVGQEADFLILDLAATPLLRYRLPYCKNLKEILFVLMTLGDDRLIEQVYAMGELVHSR